MTPPGSRIASPNAARRGKTLLTTRALFRYRAWCGASAVFASVLLLALHGPAELQRRLLFRAQPDPLWEARRSPTGWPFRRSAPQLEGWQLTNSSTAAPAPDAVASTPLRGGLEDSSGPWAPPPVAAEACLPDFKQRQVAAVRAGAALPSLVQGECWRIEASAQEAIHRLVESYRDRGSLGRDFLELVPCDLYRLIRGRTLWMLGDSQMHYFFQQLSCFLSPFALSNVTGPTPNVLAYLSPQRPQLAALVAAPLTEHMCTWLAGETAVCHLRQRSGGTLTALLTELAEDGALGPQDIMLVNFGLWYGRGADHAARGTSRAHYKQHVEQLVRFHRENRAWLPALIWHSTSPQHFDIEHGEFIGKDRTPPFGGPWECVPIRDIKLKKWGNLSGKDKYVKQGGYRNIMARPIIRGAGFPFLNTWNETVALHYLHRRGECSHYTANGAYSVWVWRLSRMLRGLAGEEEGNVELRP